MNSIIRLDTRGRFVIPNEFRETLNLKKGDEVLMGLDMKTNIHSISPIYGKGDNLVRIEIEFNDKPGSLSKACRNVSKNRPRPHHDRIQKVQRSTKARRDNIADTTKCPYELKEIKKTLLQNHSVESMSITETARNRLHR